MLEGPKHDSRRDTESRQTKNMQSPTIDASHAFTPYAAPPQPAVPNPAEPPNPFRSFWMGGYEGADHVNGFGTPLDMMPHSNGHLSTSSKPTIAALPNSASARVRETIGWRTQRRPRPASFDLSPCLNGSRSSAEAPRPAGALDPDALRHAGRM